MLGTEPYGISGSYCTYPKRTTCLTVFTSFPDIPTSIIVPKQRRKTFGGSNTEERCVFEVFVFMPSFKALLTVSEGRKEGKSFTVQAPLPPLKFLHVVALRCLTRFRLL